MKWLIVIVLAGALVWDIQSRWRAEQELRTMPWPNWMAATAVLAFAGVFAVSRRNRARVERGPIGPPLTQTRRANRPEEMEQTASIALASQSFPGRHHAAGLLGVPPMLLQMVAVSLWLVGWASGFWYATSNL